MRYEYRFESYTPAQLETTTHQDYINAFTAEGWHLHTITRISSEELLLTFERQSPIDGPALRKLLRQLVEEARRQGFKITRE